MTSESPRGKQGTLFGERWVGESGRAHACLWAMRLSRRARYALCGIFDLAYNGSGKPVRVQQIGERQGIPHRFLEQIFQDLRRARLVTGKRGPGGGYVLRLRPEEISLRSVVEAVEGPIAPTDLGGWAPSPHRPDFLWEDLSERMARALGERDVADLCQEAARRALARDVPDGLDFQI